LILLAAAKKLQCPQMPDCPDVAFYGLHKPRAPNPSQNKRDQPATISKSSDHGFESLTTRLPALDHNKKLN